MVTAVDSSVLVSIYKGERDGAQWLHLLEDRELLGRVFVCDVVVAETSGLFSDTSQVIPFLRDLRIEYDAIRPDTAIFAGSIFRAYRKAGGPREHLIPDFLIGAHALRQADQIAAADRGYLRRHFPKLKVIAPK